LLTFTYRLALHFIGFFSLSGDEVAWGPRMRPSPRRSEGLRASDDQQPQGQAARGRRFASLDPVARRWRSRLCGPRWPGRAAAHSQSGEVLLVWAGARSEGVASRARKTSEYLGLSVLDEASPEYAKGALSRARRHYSSSRSSYAACSGANREHRAPCAHSRRPSAEGLGLHPRGPRSFWGPHCDRGRDFLADRHQPSERYGIRLPSTAHARSETEPSRKRAREPRKRAVSITSVMDQGSEILAPSHSVCLPQGPSSLMSSELEVECKNHDDRWSDLRTGAAKQARFEIRRSTCNERRVPPSTTMTPCSVGNGRMLKYHYRRRSRHVEGKRLRLCTRCRLGHVCATCRR
jgi:hypothetical protein